MLYYIYYAFAAYKLYEYWGFFKFTYVTCNCTYNVANGVYKWIKKEK